MTQKKFERILDVSCEILTTEARQSGFTDAAQFEKKVRKILSNQTKSEGILIDLNPKAQAFPDVAVGEFGVEVKFTLNDTWRSVANSVLETQRIESVRKIYIVFGKMGGTPEVRWEEYEKCVIHVRTSHVPRFEIELFAEPSLFEQMKIPYDEFRKLPMRKKMQHIRAYAKGRLGKGESLWWLDDDAVENHTVPMQTRLYTSVSADEKEQIRAESALLFPEIVQSGRQKGKYDRIVLFILAYYGVLCHQARDLFSAGSVANPENDKRGGVYIERALKLIESKMSKAALTMDDSLFVEYWGENVPKEERISRWLEKADLYAKGWKPSESLFLAEKTGQSPIKLKA